MALNDTLIGEGATLWWHTEITRQLQRSRRDNDLEDERVDEDGENNEGGMIGWGEDMNGE